MALPAAAIPALITAGGSLLGGLLGGKGSKGSENSWQTAPWLAQQLDIAQGASDLMGIGSRLPVWGGSYYAPMGSDMQASWDALRGLAQGSPYVNQVWDQSRNLMGGNPFGPTTAAQASLAQIGQPSFAPGMSATTIPGASLAEASQARQDIADTYWPTKNFLNMARDSTAQAPGRTTEGAPNLSGTIPGIGNIGSAMNLMGPAPTAGTASAETNPYFGFDNPYTDRAIEDATRDMTRSFQKNTMPQLDRLMQQSGSFGNTGVQEMQRDAMSDFSRDVGDVANRMRMQDLFAQQQMGENAANRGTQVNLSNVRAGDDMSKFGYGTRASLGMFDIGNDILRQRYNSELGANLGMFDINNMLGTQRFNANNLQGADIANMGAINNMLQFGLNAVNRGEEFNSNWGNQIGTRNADAQNDISKWNSSVLNDIAARNAGFQNAASLQNSEIGKWNTSQINDAATRNATFANNMNQFNTNTLNDMAKYNSNMDWNAFMTGLGNMPWLQQQAMLGGNLLGMIGTQQQTNDQMQLNSDLQKWKDEAMNPYTSLNMYADLIGKLGQGANMGSTTNYPGNPLMGALGGATLGNYFGNMLGGGNWYQSQGNLYDQAPTVNSAGSIGYGTINPTQAGWIGPW